MPFGDIIAIVLSTRADEPVLAAAEALSSAHGVQVSATLVSVAPVSAYAFDTVGAAAAAGAWSEPPALINRDADDEHVRLIRRLERFSRPVRIERVEYVEGAGAELAGVQSRRAGLTIVLRPRAAPNAPLRTTMFERILFESGRPVLLVPPGWRQKTLGHTVLIAWDGSREATRAVADAQPFLAARTTSFSSPSKARFVEAWGSPVSRLICAALGSDVSNGLCLDRTGTRVLRCWKSVTPLAPI